MSWTPERVARAAKFWTEDGLSAAEIAQRLGGVTRNAVIGKLCRIGLAGQGSRKSGQRAYRQQPSAPRAVAVVQHRTRP
ncbi:MAG TPA: GcrA family cell cycle regulator, partial [Caulobacteraceae bacterium]|nr:GcrA family cell cycle regulator [Caulobacteraceae bacterium]